MMLTASCFLSKTTHPSSRNWRGKSWCKLWLLARFGSTAAGPAHSTGERDRADDNHTGFIWMPFPESQGWQNFKESLSQNFKGNSSALCQTGELAGTCWGQSKVIWQAKIHVCNYVIHCHLPLVTVPTPLGADFVCQKGLLWIKPSWQLNTRSLAPPGEKTRGLR